MKVQIVLLVLPASRHKGSLNLLDPMMTKMSSRTRRHNGSIVVVDLSCT